MRRIEDEGEFERLRREGAGFIYNDFHKGRLGQHNVLHKASCTWLRGSNLAYPKFWCATLEEARGWLESTRGPEGTAWRQCGTCGAGTGAGSGADPKTPGAAGDSSWVASRRAPWTSGAGSAGLRLFEECIEWLRGNYTAAPFFQERDLVWTLQLQLIKLLTAERLPLRICNDYRMIPGSHRSLCTDLAILGPDDRVELAAEFKYEPAHQRADIPEWKMPCVFWKEGVLHDIERVRRYVEEARAGIGLSVFVDEGGYWRGRPAPAGSEWIDWPVNAGGTRPVSLLRALVRPEP